MHERVRNYRLWNSTSGLDQSSRSTTYLDIEIFDVSGNSSDVNEPIT
jgi:hypothetical protein